jgi:hypothetical protein
MTTTPSYTDEQVLAIAHEVGMSPSRAGVKCKAIASLLEYMVQERQRLQAEVEASRADANRWRHFVGLIDPDLVGGFTLYQQVDLKTDQLIYDACDLTEKIDAASAKQNETKEAKS